MSASHSQTINDNIQLLATAYGRTPDNIKSLIDIYSKEHKVNDAQLNQLLSSLLNRQRSHASYYKAMTRFSLSLEENSEILSQFIKIMSELQATFIAEASKHKTENASYHIFTHSLEMMIDAAKFLELLIKAKSQKENHQLTRFTSFLVNKTRQTILKSLISAIGAAHDIIQDKGPLQNEKLSADIFIAKIQDAFQEMNTSQEAPNLFKGVIDAFLKDAIPFLAEEVIVNGTTLIFSAGNRSLANMIGQLDQIFATFDANVHLTHQQIQERKEMLEHLEEVFFMQISLELCDTRRNEMYFVLQKLEVFSNVPPEHLKGIEEALKATDILEEKDELLQIQNQAKSYKKEVWDNNFNSNDLSDLERKILRIEGFLIRMGQNIRMIVEFSKVKERIQLLEKIRQTSADETKNDEKPEINFATHIQPIIEKLGGESAFAKGLSKLAKTELPNHANNYGPGNEALKNIMNTNGWLIHAEELHALKNFCDIAMQKNQLPVLQEMFTALINIAAKPPGWSYVNDQVLKALQEYLAESKRMQVLKTYSENGLKNNNGLFSKTAPASLTIQNDPINQEIQSLTTDVIAADLSPAIQMSRAYTQPTIKL